MKKQKIEVALVPIPPVTMMGKQFNLRYSTLQDILDFLERTQPYDVIVYSPKRMDITGADNKEKGEKLKEFLTQTKK